MKRTLTLFICSFIAASVFSAQKDGPNPKHKRRNPIEFGGYVTKPNTGKIIQFYDCQKKISPSDYEKAIQSLKKNLNFPVQVTSVESSDNSLSPKTAIVITLVDDSITPRLLIAPEDKWARINVAKLLTDSPTRELIQKRFTQEVWRAVALLLGASDSSLPGCIMQPVYSLADLDRISATVPSPEPYNKLLSNAAKLGLQYTPRVPYKVACMQGWAPTPTNDIQKAIWDKVHAMPTAPLAIKPETKKVRE